MAGMLEVKEWVLISYADEGLPTTDHLQLRERKLVVDDGSIPEGHVVVRLLWLSIDPYLRSRMTGRSDGLYVSQFELNEVIESFGIGRIIFSKADSYQIGDIVINPFSPVSDYCVIPVHGLRKIQADAEISHLDYLNALGVPGFSAWVGMCIIGDPKPGDNVFITAAAGGVGVFAGQLAKIKGCRVVGSTGTDEKVQLLKVEFKYDDAFNYKKEPDLDAALSKCGLIAKA
uniref:NADP-dependent alkenal double bond reductase P1 n=1 Tax=Anthurium amnicola TaxID=1678845 RepID=A0A1D1Z3Q1_9ARAE